MTTPICPACGSANVSASRPKPGTKTSRIRECRRPGCGYVGPADRFMTGGPGPHRDEQRDFRTYAGLTHPWYRDPD